MNRAIFRLGCGLGWAEGSTSSIVAPMCPPMRAHWRHLANTIEPFVCCGDAALGQITTCRNLSREPQHRARDCHSASDEETHKPQISLDKLDRETSLRAAYRVGHRADTSTCCRLFISRGHPVERILRHVTLILVSVYVTGTSAHRTST